MKTLYALLGVSPTVDSSELETAFLRLKANYPQTRLDMDETARIQFQGLQQAYSTLAIPATRAMYDQRLARAGVKTAPVAMDGDESAGWLSTRNIIVAGLFVMAVAGMWFYHVQQQSRLQREVLERALKMAEDEKKQQLEMREAEEQRAQARAVSDQARQGEMRERQLRIEASQSIREAQSQSRQAESQTSMQQRQQAMAEQNAKQRAAYDAQRRLQDDKNQLRSICIQRYNRPDC
jgi:curved DNA-binding protein CbpA